jgi:2-C-methyl-D-erythritol 4-phosphate cytidylyltransferase
MKSKQYIIITAGGTGSRMSSNIAKQFLEIDGKPILLRTIEQFFSFSCNFELIIVLKSEQKEYWKKYCASHEIFFRHTLVSGGMTRFHSVRNALEYVPDGAIAIVHDGVRPFVSKELLNTMLSINFIEKGYDGLIPVLPAVESMREKSYDTIGNEIGSHSVDRSHFITVQTPQIFDSTKLKTAYKQAYIPEFTDDASVMERMGYKIMTCNGSRLNIKITTPEELQICRLLLPFL